MATTASNVSFDQGRNTVERHFGQAFELRAGTEQFSHEDWVDADHIRLFQIRWGPNNSIQGKIKRFSLKEPPRFMAASYCCGTRQSTKPIYLRVKRPSTVYGYLVVYENLYPLLELFCDFQGFGPDSWWWVDSICIDQSSDTEKDTQVKAMHKIYAAAQNTIIWLGPQSHDSDLAIDFLREMQAQRRQMDDAQIAIFRQQENTHKWQAVANLLARPWWKRVWTIQELLVSTQATFYCGRKNFLRRHFHPAMYSMFLCRSASYILIGNEIWDSAWNRRRMLQYHRDKIPMRLLGTMAFLGDNEATKPQDRIFALLGLVSKEDLAWAPSPDYSLSVKDLFTQLVLNFVTAYRCLDIICFAHLFNKTAVDQSWFSTAGTYIPIATWVPDWRACVRARAVPLMVSQSSSTAIGNYKPLGDFHGDAVYSASGTEMADYGYSSIGPGTLSCHGVRLGVIDGLGALIDRDGKCSIDDQVDQSTSPTNTRNSLPPSAPLSRISTSVQLELLRTLAVSLVLDRKDKYFLQYAPASFLADFVASCVAASHFPHLVLTDFLSWYEWNKHLLIRGHTLHDIFGPIDLLPSSDEPKAKATAIALLQRLTNNSGIEYSMSEMAFNPQRREETQAIVDFEAYLPRVHDTILKMNRRLMVTNEGHIGMAPSRAFKGDVVAILFGCSVPVVLRPRDQNTTSYAFVGECYVHEYMNGEAIEEFSTGMSQRETFALQ